MGFLENIRNKPQEQKIRIIWMVVTVVVVLLVGLWVATSKITKNTPKDTTLFQTLDRGIHDIKENYKSK